MNMGRALEGGKALSAEGLSHSGDMGFDLELQRHAERNPDILSQNMPLAGRVPTQNQSPVKIQQSSDEVTFYDRIEALPPELRLNIMEHALHTTSPAQIGNLVSHADESKTFKKMMGEHLSSSSHIKFKPKKNDEETDFSFKVQPKEKEITLKYREDAFSRDGQVDHGALAVRYQKERHSLYEDLFRAAEEGNAGNIRKVHRKGFDLTGWMGEQALMIAVENGHRNIVDKLRDAGLDLTNEENQAAFKLAIKRGDRSIVNEFELAGMNMAAVDGYQALKVASEKGYDTWVHQLRLDGLDMTGEAGQEALFTAASHGYGLIVSELGRAGLDMSGDTGYQALMIAAEKGHRNVISQLRRNGVDMEGDASGAEAREEAIIIAERYGHENVLEQLEDYRRMRS